MRTVLISICTFLGADAHSQCAHDHLYTGACEGLVPLDFSAFSFVPPHATVRTSERTATFIVNYNGFIPEAQEAFQYAVDIWASLISSSVPIVINANYQPLTGNTLGFAQANQLFDDFPNAPLPNIAYHVALANKLAGFDINTASHDITATFNSNYNWYFGMDGNCPGGQFDFVTVVMHELGHGLCFSGSPLVNAGLGSWQLPVRTVYDIWIENSAGEDVVDFPANSSELAAQLTGDDLFWFGDFGAASNGDLLPKMYAPATWSTGSGFSHLNEQAFGIGNINSLMSPFLAQAEAIHYPGPVTLGMMRDMGWTLKADLGCDEEEWTLALQTDCNPTQTFWQLKDDEGNAIRTVGESTYHQEALYIESVCVQPGLCYALTLFDSGGDGLAGDACAALGSMELLDASGNVILQLFESNFGDSTIFAFCVDGIPGCTDSEAINFNPEAQVDDDSCFYDCELPEWNYEVICENESASEFEILITVESPGLASPYSLTAVGSGDDAEITVAGQVLFGPYPTGIEIVLNLVSQAYPTCQATLTVPGLCPVGVSDVQSGLFEVFPNPCSGSLTIIAIEPGVLTISDLFGKSVMATTVSMGMTTFQTAGMAEGLYLITFCGEQGDLNQMVLKID